MPLYHSTKRLYLTVDDRVVGEGHPDAHQLLVPAGGHLSFQVAARYGLVNTPEDEKALEGPPATTSVEQAPANKAITRKSTKGGEG